MAAGGFNLPEGGGHHLHVGEVAVDIGDHLEEGRRVQLGLFLDVGTLDAQPHLQILLVADEDIDMFDDPLERALGSFEPADGFPQLPVRLDYGYPHFAGGLRRDLLFHQTRTRWVSCSGIF
jgi:hypothetical protein